LIEELNVSVYLQFRGLFIHFLLYSF